MSLIYWAKQSKNCTGKYDMEFNLTLEHMAGAVFLSAVLCRFLQGWLLIRSITWVFLWQLLTPTNESWFLDTTMCFALFALVERTYFLLQSTQNKPNNV